MSQQKTFKECEQFVVSVYKALGDNPSKLQTFTNLFYRFKKSNNKPIESQMKLADLIEDHPELIDKLNSLLPENYRILRPESATSSAKQQEEDANNFHKLFTELQSRRPEKLQQLIELMTSIKNTKPNKNPEKVKERLEKIFEDEPTLLRMSLKACRPYLGETTQNGHREPELKIRKEESPEEEGIEEEESEYLKTKNRAVRGAPAATRGYTKRGGAKGKRGGFRRPEADGGSPTVTPTIVLPVTVRNELSLFENLRTSLNKANYSQLMKLIYLYTECVIGAEEVYVLVKPLLKGNDNYLNLFHEMLFAREKTRRKNTEWFKPLSDIDFEKMGCQRNGSYSRLPEHFPHMKSPINPKNPKCDQVLNKTWLSVPHGSEVNFVIMAKNTYEENLFKCEDERYETDNTIYQFSTAIKWLNQLEKTESKDAINKIVDNLLRLKIPQKAYGTPSEDMVEGLKKFPAKFGKKLLEKIQSKLQETKEARSVQAKKKWMETSIENFHRSLDHRSFYFKQYEKKLTYHKNFLSDATSRHHDINMLGKTQKLTQCLQLLNTFEGLSNGVTCIHPPLKSSQTIESPELKRYAGKILPIFQLAFSNKQINQEIYEILNLKVQYFHANFTEKEKIMRYLKVFFSEIMKFSCEEQENYDVIFSEEKLLAIVARIQEKIFDKRFSFNAVRIEEAEKNNTEKTIYVAIREGKRNKEDGMEKENEVPAKNGAENKNGGGQKIEEEQPSPKKKRGGYKGGEKAEKVEKKNEESSESEEQIDLKEMEYSMQNARNIDLFEPIATPSDVVFYGTQHLYCLVRFYYTLYERFLKVFEISREFDDNPRSRLLSDEDKVELSKERYDIFKWVLAHLVRSNIDNEKYEDLLRCVFGNRAYLMFFVDRIIHMFVVTIQKMMGDEISVKTLNFFTETELPTKNSDMKVVKPGEKKSRDWPEYIYLAQINQLTLENMNSLQTTTFFRFVYDPQNFEMKINIYDPAYKNWNDKIIESVQDYTEWFRNEHLEGNCQTTTESILFLNRNKEKNKNRFKSESTNVLQVNNLEWKYIPNTTKLVPDGFHAEDIIEVAYTKKDPLKNIEAQFRTKFKRMQRFREWHQKALKK